MERTRVARSFRKTAAILCVAAVVAFLIVLWFRSYSRFNVICGPFPGSREFQIGLSNGRVDITTLPSNSNTRWQWNSMALSELEQNVAMATLKKRYQTMQASLRYQKQAAERVQSDQVHELEAKIERANHDLEVLREELQQRLLGKRPLITNTSSSKKGRSTAPPPRANPILGFSFQTSPSGTRLVVPIYFLILIIGASTVLVAQRGRIRFSLRTMLITMTIAAIMFAGFAAIMR